MAFSREHVTQDVIAAPRNTDICFMVKFPQRSEYWLRFVTGPQATDSSSRKEGPRVLT